MNLMKTLLKLGVAFCVIFAVLFALAGFTNTKTDSKDDQDEDQFLPVIDPIPTPDSDLQSADSKPQTETPAEKNSTLETTAKELYVHVLVIHPDTRRFVCFFPDIPESEIDYLEKGISSFPQNGHGDVLTTNQLIISRFPYKEDDPERFVEVWETTGGENREIVGRVSERMIFTDPENTAAIYICLEGGIAGPDWNESSDLVRLTEFLVNPLADKKKGGMIK